MDARVQRRTAGIAKVKSRLHYKKLFVLEDRCPNLLLESEQYRCLVQRLGAVAPEPSANSATLGAVAARMVRPQLRTMLRAPSPLTR